MVILDHSDSTLVHSVVILTHTNLILIHTDLILAWRAWRDPDPSSDRQCRETCELCFTKVSQAFQNLFSSTQISCLTPLYPHVTDACSHAPTAAPNKLYIADCLSSHSPHTADLSLGASLWLSSNLTRSGCFNTNCHLHMISCTVLHTTTTNHTPTNRTICTVSATHRNRDNCSFKSSNMHSKLSTVAHQLTSSSRGLRAISYC